MEKDSELKKAEEVELLADLAFITAETDLEMAWRRSKLLKYKYSLTPEKLKKYN